LIYKLSAFSS